MRSNHFSRARLIVVLVTLLLAAMSASAKDGRDFGGSYRLVNVTEQGDFVRVTLNMQIQNVSSADVKQGVVTLHQNAGMELVGRSKPIKLLRDRGVAKVSQRFTVSKLEYERWLQGAQPTVFMVYRDSHGTKWERYIQLSPGPAF